MSEPILPGDRQHAPAADRNRDPILAVLQRILPAAGTVLEVSSGTGQHAAYFAPRLAPRYWLPSDCSRAALQSIAAWQQAQPSPGLLPPIALDAQADSWPVETLALPQPIVAIVNINLLHIAPWSVGLGLLAGAGRILPAGGLLYLYGPFQVGGMMVPSNASFDQMLRQRNPTWGVRALEEVLAAAQRQGLALKEQVPMPANNLSLILSRC
ncbi:MAG: DUF938 domain-containing protein [Cyanobacteria bacterium P01_A01_bin.135]